MYVNKYDCIFINVKLFMQLVSIPSVLDFSIPFMFSLKVICLVIYKLSAELFITHEYLYHKGDD